ncbi:hypothetical protein E4U40_005832 [Claviceps sp. LM458 group G5]|nr:hypothetical protein E4U40_005832 [Claviceps sp. LM458 group G5]
MEIHSEASMFSEIDGHHAFKHTVLVIRGKENEFFWATTQLRLNKTSTIDLEKLDKIPINLDLVRPLYLDRMLRAPTPIPQDSYAKETTLLFYDEDPTEEPLSELVLREVEAYELFRKHPHPNVVEYRGCIVVDGRISGICLAKYKETLEERMEAGTPFDKDRCLEGIERGIRHLHSLNIVHNDISPYNIMLDETDRPVIIDFDSWKQNGQKLGTKMGSRGWSIEGTEYARFENDFYSLSKIRDFLYSRTP